MATYVVLQVESPAEAAMLVQDIQENPHHALSTPRWADKVHCTVAGVYQLLPVPAGSAAA